ncbi:hypothetical protein LPUS_05177 [Lasallia pustulata]|uniref:Uncharacterized protein n=1 Tax=Lasallia pustulata TaxID=136370 RepID=A0A1W5CY63_9LECA|nr:hypothetical protein LPUS_05177 [Lasallia pustulata]
MLGQKATGRDASGEEIEENAASSWRDIASSRPQFVTIDPSLEYESLEITVLASKVCSVAPVAASQIRTVLSPEPDASCLPSGEKATAKIGPEWPSRVCSVAPVAASQIRTVLL